MFVYIINYIASIKIGYIILPAEHVRKAVDDREFITRGLGFINTYKIHSEFWLPLCDVVYRAYACTWLSL
jgi:hypothetical protein